MNEVRELSHWKAVMRQKLEDMAQTLYPARPLERARFRRFMWVALYADDLDTRLRAVDEIEAIRRRVYEVEGTFR